MRPEIVAHQPGRSPHGHSGFAECAPPAESMPERIRREVPVGCVGHQLLPRLASAEHLVEAAPHVPKRGGVVRVVLVHHPIDLIAEGFGFAHVNALVFCCEPDITPQLLVTKTSSSNQCNGAKQKATEEPSRPVVAFIGSDLCIG